MLERLDCRQLNLKLPTGYGKTFTEFIAYSTLKAAERVNRLLVVVPSKPQLDQLVSNGPADMYAACIDGPRCITNVGYFGTQAILDSQRGNSQVFATTIQSLIQNAGTEAVAGLLRTGKWMIVVDEYHHYGIDKCWGDSVTSLTPEFLLAMSATPWRPEADGAFGEPDIQVSYRDAMKEAAVKPLIGHSYIYRINLEDHGKERFFTTSQLVDEAGGDTPDHIERYLVKKQMRWSPKYVSPLVAIPIERMLEERLKTGYRLQAIIGAMCVSHAKLVYEQVSMMFPELKVDWVGTGDNGRKDHENKSIIEKFCPARTDRGRGESSLDILVHVGMAGEGLDSTHVSEVIHLNTASVNNSNNQENGRAARYLPGVTGHINFDSSSEFASRGYVGSAIMDAMDSKCPSPDSGPEGANPGGLGDDLLPVIPLEPQIQIWDMELERIDSGDPEVKRYARVVAEKIPGFCLDDLNDPDSPVHDILVRGYRELRRRECEEHNAEAVVVQLGQRVEEALGSVVRAAHRIVTGRRFYQQTDEDKHRRSKLFRDINSYKARKIGALTKCPTVRRKHYQWLQELEAEMCRTKRLPAWLVCE